MKKRPGAPMPRPMPTPRPIARSRRLAAAGWAPGPTVQTAWATIRAEVNWSKWRARHWVPPAGATQPGPAKVWLVLLQ